MKRGTWRFNLIMALLLLPLLGCQSTSPDGEKAKDASYLRLHLETFPDGTHRTQVVPVYRASPVEICIFTQPFLSEVDIDRAWVVDEPGSFAIRIQFEEKHGARVLDMTTTAYKGQRVAIYADFGQARWLAAPVITRRVSDGMLTFTPDATREEADRIVSGLNRVADKLRKKRQ